MIHETDDALRRLLRARALPEGVAEVVFDAPTREWAARRNAPTVNAYLYDIREEVARRERGATAVRDASGTVRRRRQPLRWFRLSYLLTAWTKRTEDEHRLLSAVLTGLLPQETLPSEYLDGTLGDLDIAVPLTVGVPPAESRSIADIWSALGGELKPSLEVVVVAPMPVSASYPVAPPVLEPMVALVHDLGSESAHEEGRTATSGRASRDGHATDVEDGGTGRARTSTRRPKRERPR